MNHPNLSDESKGARRKTIPVETYQEAKETIRELRFKVKCFGKMVAFARQNMNSHEAENALDSGLFRLMAHTRGEKPLSWEFQGEKVVEP